MSGGDTGARDLTQGSVGKTLLKFALPSLAVNLIQVMNGTIAAIFVGKMLGEASVAATANANQIMFVVFAVVFGFSMAATILVGQAAGRKDFAEVRRTTGASIGLFTIFGLVVGVLGWAFTSEVLRALATPKEVFGDARDYLHYIMYGMPIAVLNMLLPSLLRGVGDATSPLRASVINVVVVAATCAPLINLMGIRGAALAGILSNAASLIYQVYHIYRADSPVRLRGEELALIKPDWTHAKPLLTIGFPLGLSMVIMGASQLGMIGLINREGMETVAAFGAVNQVWGFLQMPAFAVATAVSAMAAQNIGANRWDRIDRITGSGMVMNLLMSGAMVILIGVFQIWSLELFLPAGSQSVTIGAHIGLLLNWTHIFLGVATIVTAVVRSNGAVMVPLYILVITALFLRFAIGFGGYPTWGAEAIWAAFAAHAVASTLLSLAYYKWGNWRAAKVNTGAPAPEELEARI